MFHQVWYIEEDKSSPSSTKFHELTHRPSWTFSSKTTKLNEILLIFSAWIKLKLTHSYTHTYKHSTNQDRFILLRVIFNYSENFANAILPSLHYPYCTYIFFCSFYIPFCNVYTYYHGYLNNHSIICAKSPAISLLTRGMILSQRA